MTSASVPTTVRRTFSPAGPGATLGLMTQNHHDDPDLNGYVDWIVIDRSWSTFSDDCASLEKARELAGRTGGGPVVQTKVGEEA